MIRVKYPMFTLCMLYLLLVQDTTGILRISLLSSLLHEIGHVMVWIYYKKSLPELTLSPTGIGLQIVPWDFTSRQMVLLAAAGPLINLICAAAAQIYMVWGHASYWLFFFGTVNLLVGGFNLLPFGALDGRRILQAVYKLYTKGHPRNLNVKNRHY